MVASLAEGITLAQASDLPAQDLLDALFGGAMAAPVFKIKAGTCFAGPAYVTDALSCVHVSAPGADAGVSRVPMRMECASPQACRALSWLRVEGHIP